MTTSPPPNTDPAEQRHHEEAFLRRRALVETAIDKFGAYLENYLFTLTENRQDAEDLFQDLMIYVLKSFEEDKILHVGKLKLKAYHLFVDHYRKQVRRRTYTCAEPPEPETVHELKADTLSEGRDEEMKEQFFSEHPIEATDDQRDAFWLFARHQYTFTEISEKTGTPSSTIGDWVSLLRQRLVVILNEEA